MAIEQEGNKSILAGVTNILESLPKMASILLSAGTLAGIFGWFQARSYFGYFGAGWIVSELSPFQLMKFSWLTVLLLLALIKACVNDYMEMEEDGKSDIQLKRTLRTFKYSALALLCVVLPIEIMVYYWKWGGFQIWLELIQATLLLIVISKVFVLLFVFNARSKIASYMNWYILYTIFIFAFYMLPENMGKLYARIDADALKSDLPVVKLLKDNRQGLRLLYKSGSELYLTSLENNPSKEIIMAHVEDVESISAAKK
jgi:hypothetical protein